ncbi:MAG: NUDIX hydrolase [Alphaproteobacteria bacterium]
MEYLDIYNENEKLIGKVSRDEVHAKGLWHKTTHCWIIRPNGKILFQRRSFALKDNPGKLYTTASGHVAAGESLKDALQREVQEEVGLKLDTSSAKLIHKGKFVVDFTRTDGSEYHDRALYHTFILTDNSPLLQHDFQEEELEGIYEFSIKETLDLLKGVRKSIVGQAILKKKNKTYLVEKEIKLEDFQFQNQSTPYEKFGLVLEKALAYIN